MSTPVTLASLPPPPSGRTGWPWTVETPLAPASQQWPRISIVTPSFNQGQFIEETIRSVLLQGYPNLQYGVMDGGSTDDTRAVLEKYAPYLSYSVMEKDRGQSHAINKGVARAEGELFGWLNSDDFLAPGSLQLSASLLRDGRDWVVGSCRWKHDGHAGELCESRPEAPLHEWMLGSPVQQPGSLWRTDLFRRLGFINDSLRYVMDHDLFLRFKLGGIVPARVEAELATLRLHQGSKTVSTADAFRRESIEEVVPRYLHRLPADELRSLRNGVAEKLLRSARHQLSQRRLVACAATLARSIRWSPGAVASTSVRFLLSAAHR